MVKKRKVLARAATLRLRVPKGVTPEQINRLRANDLVSGAWPQLPWLKFNSEVMQREMLSQPTVARRGNVRASTRKLGRKY